MTAFLDLLLRGVGLSSQAGAVGGVFFIVLVLRPALTAELGLLLDRSLRLVMLSAVGVVLAQGLSLVVQLAALADERGWPVRDFFHTTYVAASALRIAACAGLVAGCWMIRRGRAGAGAWSALVARSAGLAAGSAGISHAAARLDDRALLLGLDALHQLAAAVWVGGLVHLTAATFRRDAQPWPVAVLRRFSVTALGAVAMLVAAGVGLSLRYVDGLQALVGTAYGVMILTKGVLLAGLLGLGAANFLAVRRLPRRGEVALVRVRRFVETEMGLGLTVMFVRIPRPATSSR